MFRLYNTFLHNTTTKYIKMYKWKPVFTSSLSLQKVYRESWAENALDILCTGYFILIWNLFFVGYYTYQRSVVTLGSIHSIVLLAVFRGLYGYWGLNIGLLYARQKSYPLYYFFSTIPLKFLSLLVESLSENYSHLPSFPSLNILNSTNLFCFSHILSPNAEIVRSWETQDSFLYSFSAFALVSISYPYMHNQIVSINPFQIEIHVV